MSRIGFVNSLPRWARATCAALMVGLAGPAAAVVNGTLGEDPSAANGNARTFVLTARQDFISTADGNSHYAWGYAHGTELPMQYPGPTLIVNQGERVRIVLNNALPVPVSLMFPGLRGVTATGGNPGLLAREAAAVPQAQSGAVVAGPSYTFIADKPGTYLYQSGTNPDLQVEMGLVGALIVRPTGFVKDSRATWKAYEHDGTEYDRETLFLLSEMDPAVHWQVYTQVFGNRPIAVDTSAIRPTLWFINGRTGPDTELEEYVGWLPTQPYNALPRMHPGEKLLMRVVNAGRDLHPFHHHGNHATPIARDAQVLSTAPGNFSKAPNLGSPDFTVRAVPGQTVDLIYQWTGKNIGWDIYGTVAENPHVCTPDANGYHNNPADKNFREWCGDHNKKIPVTIPGQLDLSYGESYSGSPFMGLSGSLPQGHPGLNTRGGYFHMWHSHNEKEVTNDNVFPGGMMTMLIIEPWTVSLDTEAASGTVGGDEVVGPKADLAITVTNGVTSVNRGQQITYTVVVTNNGPTAAAGALVTSTRPTALTAWNWSCAPATAASCGTSGNSGTGNISKALATLASGASVTFTITATVPNTATIPGNLVMQAAVAAPNGISDVVQGNNSATDTDAIVAPTADLVITNTNSLTGVKPGQAVTYVVTVTNNGPSPVANAVVAVTRPTALPNWSWNCAPTGASGCGTNNNSANTTTNSINKTLGTLASGATVTITITATVPAGATVGGTLMVLATVTAPSTVQDPNPGNNSATDSDPIIPRGAASFSPTSVAFGNVPDNTTATRAIVVTNAGLGTLRVSAVDMTNSSSGRFTVLSETCTTAGEIASTGTCTVVVTFNNGTSTTNRNGTLTVTHDGTGPTTVALSGN